MPVSTPPQPMYYVGHHHQQQQQQPPYASAVPMPAAHAYAAHPPGGYPSAPIPPVSGIVIIEIK
jgi:NaMN:DMB phosphoribosyltransferase